MPIKSLYFYECISIQGKLGKITTELTSWLSISEVFVCVVLVVPSSPGLFLYDSITLFVSVLWWQWMYSNGLCLFPVHVSERGQKLPAFHTSAQIHLSPVGRLSSPIPLSSLCSWIKEIKRRSHCQRPCHMLCIIVQLSHLDKNST